MCSGLGLSVFTVFGKIYTSWIYTSVSFPRFREVFSSFIIQIIYLNKFSALYSISPFGNPIMKILFLLFCPISPLDIFTLFDVFLCATLINLSVLSSSMLVYSSISYHPLLNSFSSSVIVSISYVNSVYTVLYFLSFVETLSLFMHYSLDLDKHHYNDYFELFIRLNNLSPISLRSFLRDFLVLSFGKHSSVILFSLILCVGF